MQIKFKTSGCFQDDILLDSDGDFLDNLREMIEGTDPYIADSDGDGVPDGDEVEIGSDPLDEYDQTAPPPSQKADIRLTGSKKTVLRSQIKHYTISVGDPSGSQSERWILHVGTRKFQNDVHGTVVSTTYPYGPGEYDIWLEHWDTIGYYGCNGGADYDWKAGVQKMGGEADVTIEDPQGAYCFNNTRITDRSSCDEDSSLEYWGLLYKTTRF